MSQSSDMVYQLVTSTVNMTNGIFDGIVLFALIIILSFWILTLAVKTWKKGIYSMTGIKHR